MLVALLQESALYQRSWKVVDPTALRRAKAALADFSKADLTD